jgi:hypothetical protein
MIEREKRREKRIGDNRREERVGDRRGRELESWRERGWEMAKWSIKSSSFFRILHLISGGICLVCTFCSICVSNYQIGEVEWGRKTRRRREGGREMQE